MVTIQVYSRKRRRSHEVSSSQVETDTSLTAHKNEIQSLPVLPQDSVFKILSELTVELSSANFGEVHHGAPHMTSETFAIVSASSECFAFRCLSRQNAKVALRKLKLHREGSVRQFSCNQGLMCHRTGDDGENIYVCNPISQHFIVIPLIPGHDFVIQGFYFDPSSYNFKVWAWCWRIDTSRRCLCMFSSAIGFWKPFALGLWGLAYPGRFLCMQNVLYQIEEDFQFQCLQGPLDFSEGRLFLVHGLKRGELLIWGLTESTWEKVTKLYPHNYVFGVASYCRNLFVARVVQNCIEVSSYDINGNKRDIHWIFQWDSKLSDNCIIRISPFTPTLLQFKTIVERLHRTTT
ncbi:hypothetical protein AMTRI_Chr08g207150 [Amborella trichopoda]